MFLLKVNILCIRRVFFIKQIHRLEWIIAIAEIFLPSSIIDGSMSSSDQISILALSKKFAVQMCLLFNKECRNALFFNLAKVIW